MGTSNYSDEFKRDAVHQICVQPQRKQIFAPSAAIVRTPPVANAGLLTSSPLKNAPTRTNTPPSGVAVCIESRRTRINYGTAQSLQGTESIALF